LLPAGAIAGWDFHPLESAAFARRTPGTEVGSFSLYHLVREREQALRESGANHVSRLFVDDEFKSRGCWIGESPGGVPRRSFVT